MWYYSKIRKSDGHTYFDTREATSVASLRSMYSDRGDTVLSYTESNGPKPPPQFSIPLNLKIQLFHLLAKQLEYNVHLSDAIESLALDFPHKNTRVILDIIHADLASSSCSIPDAFAKHRRAFDRVSCEQIRNAATSGREALSHAFLQIKSDLIFSRQIRRSFVKATAYPIALLLSCFALIGVLMVKFVPLLTSLLDALGTEMPFHTRLVIDSSEFIAHYYPHILLSVLSLFLCIYFACRVSVVRVYISRLILHIPVFGPILSALLTAQICKSFSASLSGGQTAVDAFEAAARTVTASNPAAADALRRSKIHLGNSNLTTTTSTQSLQPVTEALRLSGFMPPIALTLLKSGEIGGKIGEQFTHVADLYCDEAQQRISTAFAFLDKIILIIVGGFIGYVLLAMFGPIWTSIRAVHV
jgi:type IV pilus assembly protein PilC